MDENPYKPPNDSIDESRSKRRRKHLNLILTVALYFVVGWFGAFWVIFIFLTLRL